MFSKFTSRKIKRFTLIELLVVVLVIAILMAMLLPSLMKAKRSAQQVHCASNMRQLGLAYGMFLTDNNCKFPNSNTNGKAKGHWVGKGDSIAANKNGVLWEYVGDWRVYHCSADKEHDYRSYSINARLNGERRASKHKGGLRLSQIERSTSEVLHFIEESDPRGYNMNSFYVNIPPFQTWKNCDYAGAYHGKWYNVSFMDGHLRSYRLVWEESYIASTCGYTGFSITKGNPDPTWLYHTQPLY